MKIYIYCEYWAEDCENYGEDITYVSTTPLSNALGHLSNYADYFEVWEDGKRLSRESCQWKK